MLCLTFASFTYFVASVRVGVANQCGHPRPFNGTATYIDSQLLCDLPEGKYESQIIISTRRASKCNLHTTAKSLRKSGVRGFVWITPRVLGQAGALTYYLPTWDQRAYMNSFQLVEVSERSLDPGKMEKIVNSRGPMQIRVTPQASSLYGDVFQSIYWVIFSLHS